MEHIVHIMKYIFPRQFGLHNVFTSSVDPKETAHPFKDYTIREQEISRAAGKVIGVSRRQQRNACHLPKRLRGSAPRLIARLLKLHSRCSYVELLRYYCPLIQPKDCHSTEVTSLATPAACVSAFCRAALSRILPNELWGCGEEGQENLSIIMKSVDQFVTCRRYENMTLHSVCQGLKVRWRSPWKLGYSFAMQISCIAWLTPDKLVSSAKMSITDFNKRIELLQELVYYVFDSIVIPLLRCNFHITESSADKNRLFFFRHDIWKKLTEPHWANLKLLMFKEAKPEGMTKSYKNSLTFSHMRLVPKGASFRPIMNLRRRAHMMRHGKLVFARAINSQLKPVYSMLSFEKTQQNRRLGSSMFSVGDIHSKLTAFQSKLRGTRSLDTPLYFVKVDVKSCFDTIPQHQMVKVIDRICDQLQYRLSRYVEIKACDPHGHYRESSSSTRKPTRRFLTAALADEGIESFTDFLSRVLAKDKKNTIFVESGSSLVEKRERLMQMLEEHIRYNRVKIGKKYYRQNQGIPQGSILSSMLCNFFYGDFEENCLDFLDAGNCLLMRLIDDFLLITSSRQTAMLFLQTMHSGNEQYGITVRPEKTLTNFSCKVNGLEIARVGAKAEFPYCGTVINTSTLEIMKDRGRAKETGKADMFDSEVFCSLTRAAIGDSLTTESFKSAGETFYRKTMTYVCRRWNRTEEHRC